KSVSSRSNKTALTAMSSPHCPNARPFHATAACGRRPFPFFLDASVKVPAFPRTGATSAGMPGPSRPNKLDPMGLREPLQVLGQPLRVDPLHQPGKHNAPSVLLERDDHVPLERLDLLDVLRFDVAEAEQLAGDERLFADVDERPANRKPEHRQK